MVNAGKSSALVGSVQGKAEGDLGFMKTGNAEMWSLLIGSVAFSVAPADCLSSWLVTDVLKGWRCQGRRWVAWVDEGLCVNCWSVHCWKSLGISFHFPQASLAFWIIFLRLFTFYCISNIKHLSGPGRLLREREEGGGSHAHRWRTCTQSPAFPSDCLSDTGDELLIVVMLRLIWSLTF